MKMYVLSKAELLSLLEDQAKLEALECGGVDNWEWYGESIEESEYYDEKECEIVVDELLNNYQTIDIDENKE